MPPTPPPDVDIEAWRASADAILRSHHRPSSSPISARAQRPHAPPVQLSIGCTAPPELSAPGPQAPPDPRAAGLFSRRDAARVAPASSRGRSQGLRVWRSRSTTAALQPREGIGETSSLQSRSRLFETPHRCSIGCRRRQNQESVSTVTFHTQPGDVHYLPPSQRCFLAHSPLRPLVRDWLESIATNSVEGDMVSGSRPSGPCSRSPSSARLASQAPVPLRRPSPAFASTCTVTGERRESRVHQVRWPDLHRQRHHPDRRCGQRLDWKALLDRRDARRQRAHHRVHRAPAVQYGQVGDYNDGGVAFGPGGMLFHVPVAARKLGQTKPGSTDEGRGGR